jgi:hypothetical protein
MYESYDRADCYTSIFTPYPGSPAWQESIDKGLAPPNTLEEWVEFYARLQVLPWLSGRKHDRLQALRQYIRFGYHQVKVGEQNKIGDGPPLVIHFPVRTQIGERVGRPDISDIIVHKYTHSVYLYT